MRAKSDVTRSNINERNGKGETKLHVACIRGNFETVKALIRKGASIDVTCNAGWTPLHEVRPPVLLKFVLAAICSDKSAS
jgi:ankyrin repeat protein